MRSKRDGGGLPKPSTRIRSACISGLGPGRLKSRGTTLSLAAAGGLGIHRRAVRAAMNGGRYRDRTYGPYHVKVVLSR